MKIAGLDQCIRDPRCFKSPKGDLIISTHVDDMAGYGTPTALSAFEKIVEKEVELEKLGQPTKLLGMELTWHDKSVTLTQKECIENMIAEHQIPPIPRSIPLNPEGYAKSEQELLPPNDQKRYQSLVGSLLYVSRMTRPDIAIHINLLGRRTSNPNRDNLQVAMQLAQYLASTKKEGLILKGIRSGQPKEVLIETYADASYGGQGSRSQRGTLSTVYGNPTI